MASTTWRDPPRAMAEQLDTDKPNDLRPEPAKGLLHSSALVGGATLVSRVLGLVRDVVLANLVGATSNADAFFVAFKIPNFLIFPGSETKLLKGLELGCSGIITATCNVTSELARKVYDDFIAGNDQTVNQKLCDVRNSFEKYNLISGLHTYYSKHNQFYENVLPPLNILNSQDEKELMENLEKLNFAIKPSMAA